MVGSASSQVLLQLFFFEVENLWPTDNMVLGGEALNNPSPDIVFIHNFSLGRLTKQCEVLSAWACEGLLAQKVSTSHRRVHMPVM